MIHAGDRMRFQRLRLLVQPPRYPPMIGSVTLTVVVQIDLEYILKGYDVSICEGEKWRVQGICRENR